MAFVIAPIGAHFAELGPWVYWTAPLAPLIFAYGWIQRSATALLVGVPTGWFLVAYGLPGLGYDGGVAVLLVTLAYVVAAAQWSQGDDRSLADETRWRLEAVGDEDRPYPMLPILVGGGVALSGVVVAVWPALHARAMGAFPGLGERVIVGLGLVGTLAGLLLAVALLRPRSPLSWRPARAIVLAVLFLSSAAAWWMLRDE